VDAEGYRELFRVPLQFHAAANALVFDPSQQTVALIQANADMRDYLRRLADQTLAELERSDLSRQVRELIRREPRWGKERIAEELGISGRHLVRKLQEEGTTFKLLRAAQLQQLAEQQLDEGASIASISRALGFSDESAFAKAFKRWCGITPSQYRDGGQANASAP
jgi:AraC-like DNA-binding protein